jgi:methylated-DNA-[protein]-cysteine S-methyltransferase
MDAPRMEIEITELETPIGLLQIAATPTGLCLVIFGDALSAHTQILHRFQAEDASIAFVRGEDPHGARTALTAYLRGELDALEGLPVDLGGTPFQREVWARLRTIGVGRTSTYARLAAEIGRPSAVRAVGAANGQNPVSLIVPCHRVIASDGKLQGYGGGLDRKRWLLVHERALLA